jgi:hypothetical protein
VRLRNFEKLASCLKQTEMAVETEVLVALTLFRRLFSYGKLSAQSADKSGKWFQIN